MKERKDKDHGEKFCCINKGSDKHKRVDYKGENGNIKKETGLSSHHILQSHRELYCLDTNFYSKSD